MFETGLRWDKKVVFNWFVRRDIMWTFVSELQCLLHSRGSQYMTITKDQDLQQIYPKRASANISHWNPCGHSLCLDCVKLIK